MMSAVGIAQLNEHQLGKRHFEKPIEIMIVYVHFVHYDQEQAFLGHAVEDIEEQNKDPRTNHETNGDEKVTNF